MTYWRTKGDSNRRYSSENISLRCRPNFRSCAAKWPGEKNPQKGAKIWFAPRSHGPVLGQRNGATMRPEFRPYRMHLAANLRSAPIDETADQPGKRLMLGARLASAEKVLFLARSLYAKAMVLHSTIMSNKTNQHRSSVVPALSRSS